MANYQKLLIDTTWKGFYLRKWHDCAVRFELFFKSLVGGELRQRWDKIRYPNPAQYI